uniref:ATP receptor n=1 Tax=Romanomermis culicivorax TaxID=13658 RepID=A0A915HJC3_ROMCU
MASRNLCSALSNLAFEYETPKIVTIRDVKIGIVYRLMQLGIIAYVVGFIGVFLTSYTILYTKGYQDKEHGQSTVLTKVKGISSSYNRKDIPEIYRKVWDPSDYIVPPLTPNSVFIITNLVITARQSLGKCPEHTVALGCKQQEIPLPTGKCRQAMSERPLAKSRQWSAERTTLTFCHKFSLWFSGQMTGNCVQVFNSTKTNFTCEIVSWCPLEDDTIINRFLEQPILDNAENFTVFFKNYVEFPYFGIKRRNLDAVTDNYAKGCLYNPETDPLCPIFRLGDIARLMGLKFTQLSSYGSVINVQIKWMCNLDFSIDGCIPEVKFSDMDDLGNTFSPGYNF